MKQPARKRKKLDYPDETEGSRIAAKARKVVSKLTPEQRRETFPPCDGENLWRPAQRDNWRWSI